MLKFCEFTLTHALGASVFVNPDLVIDVVRNGNGALIVSQAANSQPPHTIAVNETLELVTNRLYKAGLVPKPWTIHEDRHY